ncbi:MAG: glycosyltransferase family 39 protein [Waddliaceae bacterium]
MIGRFTNLPLSLDEMKHYLGLLILFLLLKSFLVILGIQTGVIGLGPDEAQYWTWSQQLDWGYYSKPPGIAWQIWLGTRLFGDTELGVRFISVAASFFLAIATFFLARACRLKWESAFWSGMVMGFSPLGILGAFLATTDGGMVLFWALACLIMARALAKGTSPHYPLLGVLILLGALFKWPMYLFWIFVFLAMRWFPYLQSRTVFPGIALSLLGLLPSIIWNRTHDWATFRHVLATIKGGHANELGATPLLHGNFWEFVGAQISLLSPILFVLLLIAFVVLIRNIRDVWPQLIFCGAVSILILAAFSLLSIVQKVQGNWCVFAYPSGIVVLCWFACERARRGKQWLVGGVVLSIILSLMVLGLPILQEKGILSIPYKWNPFRHNIGWEQLKQELATAGFDDEQHFLFGDKYQMSSILSFYQPGQKRAYFLNLLGVRKNQFSYWPSMEDEQTGKTGFFVAVENAPHLEQKWRENIPFYRDRLQDFFEEIDFLGEVPLFYVGNRIVKSALIFRCINYQGKTISSPKIY